MRARALHVVLAASLGSLGASCKEAPIATPEPQRAAATSEGAAGSASGKVAPAPAPSADVSAADSAAPAPKLPPGVTGASLAEKAEACWASATCALDEAKALFTQADDAGAIPMNCYRFYYGTGVPLSLERARRCFERIVKDETRFEGQSPSVERTYLAAMLVDGQGGPAAPDRAKALLKDCYADISVTGLLEEITKREGGQKPEKPLDFCRDIGGTTLSMQGCAALDAEREEFEEHALTKALAAKLDETGLDLAKKAAKAYADFATKDAEFISDVYRGGSLRAQVSMARRTERIKERRVALRMIFEYALGSDDPAEAEKALDKELRAATAATTDGENKKLLTDAQAAWRAYRAAEVALYRRALGAKLGEAAVDRDVRARLARARIVTLKDKISMEN